MNGNEVPIDLLPAKTTTPLPVLITPESEKSMDPDRMASACRELGLVHITPSILHAHILLGEQIEKMGAIKLSQSGSFMGQQFLLNALAGLANDMAEAKEVELRKSIAHEMGYVSGKMAMQNKNLIEASPAARQDLQPAIPRASFLPGSNVPHAVFAQNVQQNFNTGEPKKEAG